MAESEPDDPSISQGPTHGRIGRDLFWAYAAAGAKVLSWGIVSAILFRASEVEFAIFALLRATLGILNLTSLGLAPAMVRVLAEARAWVARRDRVESIKRRPGNDVLSYADADTGANAVREAADPVERAYANGVVAALIAAAIGLGVTIAYASVFDRVHRIPPRIAGGGSNLVLVMGIGVVLRLFSDAYGAILQALGRIARDNQILLASELAWAILMMLSSGAARSAVGTYLFCSCGLLLARMGAARGAGGRIEPQWKLVNDRDLWTLLSFGLLVMLGQLADFLYAPINHVLINRFLGNWAVAEYSPAVQIDAALLLLVTGLSAVLLPRTATAFWSGDTAAVRRYYVRGTVVSFALLLLAAAAVWLISPWLFRLWLGDEMPATRAILPLVLVHTVIGGSSAVGRSILLGMGRVKPYTAAALSAGVMNVVLSYVFVRYFGWGLKGIVLGTICVVVGRCALWMPWYVLRVTRDGNVSGDPPQVAGYTAA